MTTPTTAQIEAVATDLEAQAATIRGWETVTPTPPPVPTPTPTPVPTPSPVGSYIGRSVPDPTIFNPTPVFANDFAALMAEGQMFDSKGNGLGNYVDLQAYPTNYTSTDKSGYYDPGRASVVKTSEGGTALQMRLVSGKSNSNGKPSGVCVQAAPGGNALQTTGEKVEGRFCLLTPGPGGHLVPLGWPPKDSDWPVHGEPDYLEIDTNAGATVGGWLHVENGGSNGQGQVQLTSNVPASAWFTVGHERIPGKSYKWFVNGKLQKQVLSTDLKAPYGIPQFAFRWPIQFETKGTNQANDVIVLVDWWTAWGLK